MEHSDSGRSAHSRVPRNPIGMGRVAMPPLVTRGSAPKGTFQIPDEGLRVPQEQSFLSRFQNNRWQNPSVVRKPSAPANQPRIHQKPKSPNPIPPPYVHEAEAEEITAATASVRLSSPRENSEQGGELRTNVAETVASRYTNGHAFASANSGRSAPKQALEESSSEIVTTSFSEYTRVSQLHEKTPEQVADEAEDTLINIVSESDSLLSEARPSYPVLRFCAAKGLLDVQALDNLGLPLGFIWSPFGELHEVPRIPRAPKRCGTCGSFVAKGNGGEDVLCGSRVWICGFCGRNDNDAGEAGFQANIAPQSYPELSTDTVEYLHPQSAARSHTGRGAIVLIVDENINPEEATWARAAAAAVHTSASEKGLRFALLTVGSGCAVAVQTAGNHETPILEMMSVARATKLTPEEKERFFLNSSEREPNGIGVPNGQPAELHRAVTDGLITPRSLPASYADEPNAAGEILRDESVHAEITRLPPEAEARRLDMALFIAFEVISGMADSENSRIISLITGPPTLAEHALRRSYLGKDGYVRVAERDDDKEAKAALANLYEQAGSRAGDMRIALDFLCFGAPHGFGGDILLGAAKRSRGGIVYTAAHSFSAASALAEAATFLAERSTSPGVVSIRVSSPLIVARVIGPAFPTAAPHTYAVPGIDPLTGFTIILKSKAGIESETKWPSHAVLQLAAKSLEATRVVTARIPVTRVASEYLATLDPEICALVLGKACCVSGGALTQPAIAARSIDVSVRRLLQGSETSAGVVRLLFELRRGLLIEQHVTSDCALVLRSFFLRAECGIASLLMSPRLFTNAMSDESTGLMGEVPLEKQFITQDAVLVLDTGFNVFVYVGENASAEAEEAISESARSVAAQRLSPCQLWKMRAGRDADYVLDSYLSPSANAGSSRGSPLERGFQDYCASHAPDSSTVKALRGA